MSINISNKEIVATIDTSATNNLMAERAIIFLRIRKLYISESAETDVMFTDGRILESWKK